MTDDLHPHRRELLERRVRELSALIAVEQDEKRSARLAADLRATLCDLHAAPSTAVPGALGLARFAC